MKKTTPTIIFDFGNVLIDLDSSRFYKNVEQLLSLESPEEWDTLREWMLRYETGSISTDLFINKLIKISPQSVQARDIIQVWNSMLIGIRPETLELLKALKMRYRTYILSNTNALHIDWVLDHLETVHNLKSFETEYLSGVFYSHELQMRKPNAEIYEYVMSSVGNSPQEILFIDDLKENVEAARNTGWQAVVHSPDRPISETLLSCNIILS